MDPRSTTKLYSFEKYEEEDDDDVFYDELRRQVMQLTAEDDDSTTETRKQGPLYNHGPCSVCRPGCHYDWPGNKEDCATAPAWILSLWRSGNGTGVFIPQNVQSGRKNRSRRKKTERGITYRPVARMN
ncbi:hypothetical protein DH2020_032420 [Rehmannia glutinosa]|uniref:Uncharacterized protein n=1 Tax=Rehmannia glutinosa TaxID=99300 RepID=A0ABR0VIJ0_REHGL